MNFVIGDVHGEISKLRALIKYIFTIDKSPSLIFIGDYLDKGEDPVAVLDFLSFLNKETHCTFLYGNHEFCWLNLQPDDIETITYLSKYGGKATLQSLKVEDFYEGKEKLVSEYGEFFDSLRSHWKNDSYIAIHSGLTPDNYSVDIDDIPLRSLLFNRYDFIRHNELYQNRVVIFGHTGFFSPYVTPTKIGIDTSACFLPDQPISAFCIEKSAILNSDSQLKVLADFEQSYCPNIVRTNPWRYDKRVI